jgi:iron complex transport system substrate-binding protein
MPRRPFFWLGAFCACVLCLCVLLTGVRRRAAVRPDSPAAVIVTDDLGRRIALPRPPRRIVSLAPSVTEIFYAVGAGDRLVGDTVYCDFPPQAATLPHVGGPINPSAERIVRLRPDLVVVASQTLAAMETDRIAARWRAPVYVTAAATYAGVERDVAALGALAGQPRATEETLRGMENAENTVRRAVRGRLRPRVFVVVWDRPLMTAGGGSFIGDLVRLAGGVNVAERAGDYPAYAPERLLRDQPDVLLTGANKSAASFPGASALRAVRTRRVYAITGDLTDRPGPRLGLGLLAVARALHPEAFVR